MNLSLLDFTSFIWFLICWIGYSIFARKAAKRGNTLSSVLYLYRKEWVDKLCLTGMSEVDSELLGILEKQVSFFASTSLLILASLVTVLTTSSEHFLNFTSLGFVADSSLESTQIKLLFLIVIFTYAFFTFTWSIRQYGFCFIIFGSSFHTVKYFKEAKEYRATATNRDFHAMAKVLDRAGHSHNYGLRAYYFALSVLGWFINPWLFMAACTATVFVLYRREFKSSTVQALIAARTNITEDAAEGE